MFLARRPSAESVAAFLRASKSLELSYEPVGLARRRAHGFDCDEANEVIGSGGAAFERAKSALASWTHFALGWVELHPGAASIEPGTDVAVLVRHLGFWSLNGARVVYGIGAPGDDEFGFAYGTLSSHAECGEEIFAVTFDRESGDVRYSIRAASRPQAALAKLGYPIVRSLQRRFRADSVRAMRRAVSGGNQA